ncbi:MAG TPA: hypothetical protein VMC07_02985 [Candidatus Omnitrophota bacterium]|nr:hypothetical protein [Candidatus Omnitrophota bacterium]
MSLAYNLLGIPRNEYEFIESAKNKGIESADISTEISPQIKKRNAMSAHYTVRIHAKYVGRLKLAECTYIKAGSGAEMDWRGIEKDSLAAAVQKAELFQNNGFNITINFLPVESVKKEIGKR